MASRQSVETRRSLRSRPESVVGQTSRPPLILSDGPLVAAEPEWTSARRPLSSSSSSSAATRPTSTTNTAIIPIAYAMVEDPEDDRLRISISLHARNSVKPTPPTPPRQDYEDAFSESIFTSGNRHTLTLTDAELSEKLHEQMSSLRPFTHTQNAKRTKNGKVDSQQRSLQQQFQVIEATSEIVRQEIADRRAAQEMLDEEIRDLESQLLSRQLNNIHGESPEDEAINDVIAFDIGMDAHEKLDYMRPQSHRPYFSLFIFLLTTLVLGVEILVNGGIEPFAANPTFGPKPDVLILMGAKKSDLILAGEYHRLLIPIVLHAGILHFLFNMLGLWNVGVPMEREFGTWRIALIYVGSGLMGILVSCIFSPNRTSVGASGAIFGLFGCAWADLIQNWGLYKGAQIRMFLQLLLMTLINLALGLMPFLDNFAHIGGFIAGVMLGFTVLIQTRYYYSGIKKKKRNYQLCLMACSSITLPALFIGGYCAFFWGVKIAKWCTWCAYISCIPMPPSSPYDQRWWNCDDCSQGGLAGSVSPNNTLSFRCPNSNLLVSEHIPSNVTINIMTLVASCLANCPDVGSGI